MSRQPYSPTETIVAQATPAGKGGVGILRVSGPQARQVALQLLGKLPKARYADYLPFVDQQGNVLDQGIALWFPAPHSFTGEDVLELQGHGGQIILDLLLQTILTVPQVRLAKPGEFSEQAFLNNKIDLVQAEAIADLIDASSVQAARSAMQSLQGHFSQQINQLLAELTHLRVYVEAAIDFPDEEIDFLADGHIAEQLQQLQTTLTIISRSAQQGSVLREGMKVVIAGKPNAGKSSLLNALAEKEAAIVTDIAGTTRDVLREYIQIDGMPLHIIDTAGLRQASDQVEQIGIERAWQAIEQADVVLLVVDSQTTEQADPATIWPEFTARLPAQLPMILIRNKIDRLALAAQQHIIADRTVINLSAKTGEGVELLRQQLKAQAGYHHQPEGSFLARRRHLTALAKTEQHLQFAQQQRQDGQGELLAEELRLAQQALAEITGKFSADDLLGEIFASFCIGK